MITFPASGMVQPAKSCVRVVKKNRPYWHTRPGMRTIVAFSRGFNLDLTSTEKLLQLAGHAFDESEEHQALRFCASGAAGSTIEECNEFLQSYGYAPLGTRQRL